eukprot:gene26095-biopygen13874
MNSCHEEGVRDRNRAGIEAADPITSLHHADPGSRAIVQPSSGPIWSSAVVPPTEQNSDMLNAIRVDDAMWSMYRVGQ